MTRTGLMASFYSAGGESTVMQHAHGSGVEGQGTVGHITKDAQQTRRGIVGNVSTIIMFCIGLGVFLYPLLINYLNYHQQSEAINMYDEAVSQLSASQIRKMWNDALRYNDDLDTPTLKDPFKFKNTVSPLDRYSKTLNVDNKGMMAYLSIPKINLKLPIYHGTTDAVLIKGAGHISTTHLPTNQINIHPVLTGHTGENGHIFFDNITQLKKGDVFQLTVLTRHMSYKVDKLSIIKPTDTSQIQPEYGKNQVTLLTCYPYGINDHRYLVRAHYIGDDVKPTQPSGVPIWVMWILLLALLLTSIGIWVVRRQRLTYARELSSR